MSKTRKTSKAADTDACVALDPLQSAVPLQTAGLTDLTGLAGLARWGQAEDYARAVRSQSVDQPQSPQTTEPAEATGRPSPQSADQREKKPLPWYKREGESMVGAVDLALMKGSAEPVPGLCGAKMVKTDPPRYCTKHPIRGRTRCKFHGGATKRGAEHPRFNGHRRRYPWLSPKLANRVADAEADAQLLDLRPDLALLEVLKEEAARGLELGASVEAWKRARALCDEARKARANGAVEDAVIAEEKLRDVLHGKSPALAREEVARMLERKARFVEHVLELQVKAQNLIAVAHVQALLSGIDLIVREFIVDQAAQAKFSERMLVYIGERLMLPGAGIEAYGRGADNS